jgi:apolipoprotein D and lipocalin family protein
MPQAPAVNARIFAALLPALVATACAGRSASQDDAPPLRTVERVELERYLGVWYEIASYPQRFQKDCTGTTATYSAGDDDDIVVVNRCRKHRLDGELDEAQGLARVVDPATNAKLEVSFFRPFWGDYWIIDLGEDYEFAVVGHPSREYLWVLSRTPTMDVATYGAILERLEAQGYDTTRLQKTLQPTA